MAANISINAGVNVEFGQGVSISTTCDASILFTAHSTFINSSGTAGEFYFSGFRLSDIDVNACSGTTFTLKAYDSGTVSALTLFGASDSVVIKDSATVLHLAEGQNGVSMSDTGTIGTATITFASPLALATSVKKITLESTGMTTSSQSNSASAVTSNFSTVSSFALYPDIYASTLGSKIYAVGGAEEFGSNVYVSSDTGTSWSVTTLPTANAMTVAASQDGSKVWVAGSNRRIYLSTDGGSSFSLKYTDYGASFQYGATDDSGTKFLVHKCGNYSEILMTTDDGVSWQSVATPVTNQCGYYGIAISGSGSDIFISRYNGYIYKSGDIGASWAQLTGAGSRYWKGFAVSTDGNYIVAAAHNDYAYYSTNGGSTWARANGPISSYWQTAAVDPSGRIMAVASANGDIYVSTNYGSTWSEISLGISRQYWYSSAISSDGKYLFLGTYSYGAGSYVYKVLIPSGL